MLHVNEAFVSLVIMQVIFLTEFDLQAISPVVFINRVTYNCFFKVAYPIIPIAYSYLSLFLIRFFTIC